MHVCVCVCYLNMLSQSVACGRLLFYLYLRNVTVGNSVYENPTATYSVEQILWILLDPNIGRGIICQQRPTTITESSTYIVDILNLTVRRTSRRIPLDDGRTAVLTLSPSTCIYWMMATLTLSNVLQEPLEGTTCYGFIAPIRQSRLANG